VSRFLIQIVTGPENATKAALGFLIARTAVEANHEVTVFVVGDAVNLLRRETADVLSGVGTGSLKEHLAAIEASAATVYYSGFSAKARGLGAGELAIARARQGFPVDLVALAAAADVVLTY
jgi:predicted peroxiredoxin